MVFSLIFYMISGKKLAVKDGEADSGVKEGKLFQIF